MVVEKAWTSEGVAVLVVVVVGGNIVVMGMKCRVGARVPIEGRRRHLQQLGEAMLIVCTSRPFLCEKDRDGLYSIYSAGVKS